jgi:hypothetical protein
MATTHMMNTIKEMVRQASVELEKAHPTTLLEIYKIYQKLVKQWPGKEKEVLVPMKELYARTRERTDLEKIQPEEVLRFCGQEIAKQKVAVNQKKKLANASRTPGGVPFGPGGPSMRPQQQVAPQSATSVLAPMEVMQLRAQILTYVAKMERFTADLAMSSVNNLSTRVVAGMVGLSWADQPRDLAALVQKLTSLAPSQVAQVGLSSQELLLILNFAKHFSIDLVPINALVTSQKKYESDFTKKILAANKAGTFMNKSSGTATSQAGLPPVKQTVPFKAKHDPSSQVVKKFMQNVLKNAVSNKSPVSTENSLAKFSEMLSSAGATLLKPGQQQVADRKPAPPETKSLAGGSASLSAASSVQSLAISKKFPHLTISSVDKGKIASSASSPSASPSRGMSVKGPPATVHNATVTRPFGVKAFATLHADSTNIAGGESRSPAAVAGYSSGKGQTAASGETRSPVSRPSAAGGAAGMWKASAGTVGRSPGNKSNQAKIALGGNQSIAALRDFKAQVKIQVQTLAKRKLVENLMYSYPVYFSGVYSV